MHGNSPVSELDRESNHSWEMWIYKSSRGSSRNISVQCTSVAQPHRSNLNMLGKQIFLLIGKFILILCRLKKKCNYSPHLNESFKCVLTTEGTGERGLKPWSIFLHSGLHLKDMTVRPISSKKMLETNTRKSLPDRIPIENMSWEYFDVHILSPTMYSVMIMRWRPNTTGKETAIIFYCYWTYLWSLFTSCAADLS